MSTTGIGKESSAPGDDRWLVIDGRRWRRTDPLLPDDVVQQLKSHLGRARSLVGVAGRTGDEAAREAARERVSIAKHGLGERGPRWCDSDPAERIARARAALKQLDDR